MGHLHAFNISGDFLRAQFLKLQIFNNGTMARLQYFGKIVFQYITQLFSFQDCELSFLHYSNFGIFIYRDRCASTVIIRRLIGGERWIALGKI